MRTFKNVVLADPEKIDLDLSKVLLETIISIENLHLCETEEDVYKALLFCYDAHKSLPDLIILNSHFPDQKDEPIIFKIDKIKGYDPEKTKLIVLAKGSASQQEINHYSLKGIPVIFKPITLQELKTAIVSTLDTKLI